MKYQVITSSHASFDLEEIDCYISRNDSPAKAAYVMDRLETACASLYSNPNRGSYPPEMAKLGVHDYREIFFKPYRIIYKVSNHDVYILLIADGRRDLRTLLLQRLTDVSGS